MHGTVARDVMIIMQKNLNERKRIGGCVAQKMGGGRGGGRTGA